MKKILFFAFIAIAAISCTQNGYKIAGEFGDNKFDSVKVFLAQRVNREWINIDSAVVQNGKFEFKGVADSAKVAYLRAKTNAGLSFVESFILENGNVTVKVDTAGLTDITGTKENDILHGYALAKRPFDDQMNELFKEYKKITNKDSMAIWEKANEEKMKKIEDDAKKVDVDYALKNVNTLAGSHIFMNSFYSFTVAEKEALFAKMDAKTKAIPRIAELIAATEVEKKTSTGQPFVDFSMPAPDGKTVKLSDFVGKTDYLLIDFWASWCGPCIRSFPELTAFYAKNKGPKFDIVGVSLDQNKEEWTGAIAKYKLVWNHMSDLQYWKSEGAKLYAVNAIPATVLIDKTGKIVGRSMSLTEIQDLLNQIVTK